MLNSGIEIEKRSAEKVHRFLISEKLLEFRLKALHSAKGEKIIFPVKETPRGKFAELKKIAASAKLVKKKFSAHEFGPESWAEAVGRKLSASEKKFMPSSFDSLGDVAIIEIPKELKGKEKVLAEALLRVHKSFESVYMKTGAHEGVFRQEPVKLLAGKMKKFATYKEHGCTFHISIGKVFFSPRLSTERKRISALIKPGEKVAALFAGTGPFPIVFAKNSKMGEAVAIELNPRAVQDMKENIALNRVQGKVEPVLGDVKKLAPKFSGKFDRAVMPLPKGGETFLEDALKYLKPQGGVVHFYQFVSTDSMFAEPLKQIEKACKAQGKKFEVLEKRKVRSYAPDIVQVVVDFRAWDSK